MMVTRWCGVSEELYRAEEASFFLKVKSCLARWAVACPPCRHCVMQECKEKVSCKLKVSSGQSNLSCLNLELISIVF